MDLYRMASFPFLSESIAFMKAHPGDFASITELAEDILYEGVRELAMGRVHAVLRREEIPRDFHSPEECREEVLSYILSRILIGAVGDPHLIRWYSLAESVRAQKLLSDRTVDDALDIAADIGITGEPHDDDHIELGFIPYITYSSSLKSYDWKLANQSLKEGNVILSKDRFIRILLEALKAKFERELSAMTVPEHIRELFKSQLEEISGITTEMKEAYDDHVAKVVIPWRFPPCVHHLLGMTQKGENVSHSGRFAMTSFFLHIGMTVDEIIDLFKVSPDFREDLARYQVEHIHGDISGTDYDSMACKTMVTYALCTGKDRLCEKIVHPLGYYEARNDDCLPQEQRRLRRALSASSEIARTLKVPVRELQKSVMEWFAEKAVIMMPEVGKGLSTTTSPTQTDGDDSDGGGEEPIDGKVQETSGAGSVVAPGQPSPPPSLPPSPPLPPLPPTSSLSSLPTSPPLPPLSPTSSPPSPPTSPSLPPLPPTTSPLPPSPPLLDLQRPSGLFNGKEADPSLFRLKVIRAWLHGIKVLHPGTMETVYYVGTTGIVDDHTGRAIRLLPILDFEHGQILRDFQKTGRELDVGGQIYTVRGRQFLHVFHVEVPG